jgi:hypothetical protein
MTWRANGRSERRYLQVTNFDVILLRFFILATLHVSGVLCPSSGVNLLHGQPLALTNCNKVLYINMYRCLLHMLRW